MSAGAKEKEEWNYMRIMEYMEYIECEMVPNTQEVIKLIRRMHRMMQVRALWECVVADTIFDRKNKQNYLYPKPPSFIG